MSRRSDPTYYVIVQEEGGEELKLDLTDRVLSLEYIEEEDKADLLSLTVRNWDLANFDDPIWKPGNRIFVAWGYPGNMSRQRQAVISNVTGSIELAVEAQGLESSMNRVLKCRTFTDRTRAEVVREIAQEHGFDVGDLSIDDTEERCETITQAQMTDAQFLRRLSEIEGFEFFTDVDGLHFKQRRMGQKPKRTLVWYPFADSVQRESGATESGDILEFNIESDIFFSPKDKAGKVTIKARDPITKEDITEIASESETVRDKTAPAPLVVDQDASDASGNNGAAQSTQVTEVVRSSTQYPRSLVKREADGQFRKMANATVELSMTIIGDPRLEGKTVVEVLNISKRYSGLYYVKAVAHSVGDGYTATLTLTSDGVNSVGKVNGAAATNANATNSKAKTNSQKGPPPGQQSGVVTLEPVTVEVGGEVETLWKDTMKSDGLPPFDPNNPAAAFFQDD